MEQSVPRIIARAHYIVYYTPYTIYSSYIYIRAPWNAAPDYTFRSLYNRNA